MSQHETADELPFGTDFSERVLAAADRIKVRRQRARWAAVGVSVPIVAAVIALAPWRGSPTVTRVQPAAPDMVASIDADARSLALAAASDARPDPADYMFPDAAPLARFSNDYANASKAGVGDDTIFSDETDAAEGS